MADKLLAQQPIPNLLPLHTLEERRRQCLRSLPRALGFNSIHPQTRFGGTWLGDGMGYLQEARENHVKKKVEEGEPTVIADLSNFV
jgi:hypothetical protein